MASASCVCPPPYLLLIPLNVLKKYEKYAKYAGASRGVTWWLLAMHTFRVWSKQSMKVCSARAASHRRIEMPLVARVLLGG